VSDRPTTGRAAAPPRAGFTVARASPADWKQVVEWTALEGWNPGRADAACFHVADPAGFFVGRLGGRIVSAISLVTYSPEYAFLGYYLVHPEHRGTGLGLATWTAALPHAGSRTIGLDAVPAQQSTYTRAGFAPAYTNVRYSGRPRPPAAPTAPPAGALVPVDASHLDAIAAYDRTGFPADRRAFLTAWLTAPDHTARVLLRDGAVAGYGVIRPAHQGRRVGPLFAASPEIAASLVSGLAARTGAAAVAIDMPDINKPAIAMAERIGLKPSFETARMYTGSDPKVDYAGLFGVTSLELG